MDKFNNWICLLKQGPSFTFQETGTLSVYEAEVVSKSMYISSLRKRKGNKNQKKQGIDNRY
jgi:hypothetical protein